MASSISSLRTGLMPRSVMHPLGKKILRRDLQHVHTAQQSDILPTGDDRADLRGTALHQTHGHGGDQRTGQRRAQAEYTGQRSERRSGILAVKQGEQECSHAAPQQDAGKLLLVFIRCAAGFAARQKAFHQAGGTADQHIGARFRQPGGHGAQYPRHLSADMPQRGPSRR